MPLCAEMNKAAPKLTIAFQLTVWSIVGIILVQKGTRSLYESTRARDDTLGEQENPTTWNKGETARETLKSIPGIERQTLVQRSDDARDARSVQTPATHARNRNKVAVALRSDDHETTVSPQRTSSIPFGTENSTSAAFTASNEPHNRRNDQQVSHKDAEKSRNERKTRRSPVNKIGAAVAIVMLAIGIVMLILGPLIVIVRAVVNKRRTRKILLKLRDCSDQPPSYEEATSMDRVPRYSTLQLETILDSSSSSSSSSSL